MELVYPDGLGAKAKNDDLNISFQPSPNYAALAAAAAEGSGNTSATRVSTVAELRDALEKAGSEVMRGRSVFIEVLMEMRA